MKLIQVKYLLFIINFLIFDIKSSVASSLFVPDSDTGLLISLVGNTAQQLTRLEQLISETDKHTKLFRESVEMVEERYEVVEQLKSMADNYARIATSSPDDLTSVNDAIEDLINQKERLADLIKKTRGSESESAQVKSNSKIIQGNINSDNNVAKKQILKSFGSGKLTTRNMERVNAQNTSLILKESISLNSSANTTNNLLATQNSLSKIQVDQIILENASKNNAFKPSKKKAKK